jgi:uncharacterized protein YbaR (Trm112 family)
MLPAMSAIPPQVLELLRCPRCHGEPAVEPLALRCDACRLRYRDDHGILDMLIEDAEPLDTPAG